MAADLVLPRFSSAAMVEDIVGGDGARSSVRPSSAVMAEDGLYVIVRLAAMGEDGLASRSRVRGRSG